MHFIIEKSGTGIEKSGTGIEKSGTGLGRSMRLAKSVAFGCVLSILLVATAHASGQNVMLSKHGKNVQISLHTSAGIFAGTAALARADQEFLQIDLQNAFGSATEASTDNCGKTGLMTQGSGTGSVGPCGGSGVKGTNSGLLTQGSGTGSVGPCTKGGSGLATQGSGTGSVDGCSNQLQRWGIAEIVFSPEGTFILISQDSRDGLIEVLSDFKVSNHALSNESGSAGFNEDLTGFFNDLLSQN